MRIPRSPTMILLLVIVGFSLPSALSFPDRCAVADLSEKTIPVEAVDASQARPMLFCLDPSPVEEVWGRVTGPVTDLCGDYIIEIAGDDKVVMAEESIGGPEYWQSLVASWIRCRGVECTFAPCGWLPSGRAFVVTGVDSVTAIRIGTWGRIKSLYRDR